MVYWWSKSGSTLWSNPRVRLIVLPSETSRGSEKGIPHAYGIGLDRLHFSRCRWWSDFCFSFFVATKKLNHRTFVKLGFCPIRDHGFELAP